MGWFGGRTTPRPDVAGATRAGHDEDGAGAPVGLRAARARSRPPEPAFAEDPASRLRRLQALRRDGVEETQEPAGAH